MVHKGLVSVDEVKESVNCVREKQVCDKELDPEMIALASAIVEIHLCDHDPIEENVDCDSDEEGTMSDLRWIHGEPSKCKVIACDTPRQPCLTWIQDAYTWGRRVRKFAYVVQGRLSSLACGVRRKVALA